MNAIVLAAGVGSRLQPLTFSVPKPLTVVNNEPIIEGQIRFLRSVGVEEIHIVVGYKAEQFHYLRERYGVNLVYNPLYSEFNNIYSLYLCKDFLKDTWILEGDVFIRNNMLKSTIGRSCYFSVFRTDLTREWVLESAPDHRLMRILSPADEPGLMYPNGTDTISGISCWNQSATRIMKHYLSRFGENIRGPERQAYGSQYWDQIVIDNLDEYEIFVEKVENGDCFEVDTESDLDTLKNIL